MTIYVIDKATNEVAETYDNVAACDLDAKTVTIPAGRGMTTVQFGEDVILKTELAKDTDDIDPAEALAELEALL